MFNVWAITVELYQELFRQSSLNSSFCFVPDKRDRKILIKFCKHFKTQYKPFQLNVDLFVQYFEFQFSRYSGTYSRGYGKNKIMFSWVVGNKAIQAWEHRDISLNWKVKYKLNDEVVLRLRNVFKDVIKTRVKERNIELFTPLSEIEEVHKQKFYNLPHGIIYCDIMTTLYHKESKWCKNCVNSEECINRLSKLYPILYNIRINGQRTDTE